MKNWKIYCLFYGDIEVPKEALTAGVDVGLKITIPYLGFLLTDGEKKILVDTGINERFIVNGKAWGGFPARGGTKYVSESLQKIGVKPEDIDTVLYTHLHNDHTGASHLFKRSIHIFQHDEWNNLMDPLPSQKLRGDYDPETIPVLKEMECIKISGDLELEPGIKLYKTPGHTLGSMVVAVQTEKGLYVITGDTTIIKHNLFPKLSTMIAMDGAAVKITPAPDIYGPAIPSSLVYNHYEWYKSIYLLKTLVKKPEFALTGHDPEQVGKVYPT